MGRCWATRHICTWVFHHERERKEQARHRHGICCCGYVFVRCRRVSYEQATDREQKQISSSTPIARSKTRENEFSKTKSILWFNSGRRSLDPAYRHRCFFSNRRCL